MMDLTEHASEGEGTLTGGRWKLDGESGGGLCVDLDVAFGLEGDGDAEVVDRAVPGAARLVEQARLARRAGDEATNTGGAVAGAEAAAGVAGRYAVRVPDPHVLLTLAALDGGLVVLSEASAELMSARLVATSKSVAFNVKVRVYGSTPAQAPGLLGLLGKRVTLAIERKQQALFPPRSGDAPDPQLGSLVVGEGFAGILIGWSEDDDDGRCAEVQEVDGSGVLVARDRIESSIRVVAPDGKTLDGVLKLYKTRATKAGVKPLWRHLAVALGQAYGNGNLRPIADGCWELTPDVVARAIELGRDEPAAKSTATAEA